MSEYRTVHPADIATYTVLASNISVAMSNDHVLVIDSPTVLQRLLRFLRLRPDPRRTIRRVILPRRALAERLAAFDDE